ncbi:MAG: acyloxyacyl hydrolase [Rhodospirillales bacterium]
MVLDTPPAPLIKPALMLTVPWAAAAHPATRPAAPAAAGDGPTTAPPARPSPSAGPAPPADDEAAAREEIPREGAGKTLAEVRIGALKHAIAFGHQAKETGMDANIEALFASPGWLDVLWSPRPHLGATLNASTTNTDFVYTGLTWDWAPLWGLFAGFGAGVSVHDGMLDNSQIEGKARFNRREFGCRALFRGSLEVGYRFLDRHSLSAMWAHHSHLSLCSEENEGIDNAGLRYGYRL